MPYPFVAAMSFKDLRDTLENKYGCKFEEGKDLPNHLGESLKVYYVKRMVDSKEIRRTVDFGGNDDMVNPNVLRATCVRLKIDVTDFPGYHLG